MPEASGRLLGHLDDEASSDESDSGSSEEEAEDELKSQLKAAVKVRGPASNDRYAICHSVGV